VLLICPLPKAECGCARQARERNPIIQARRDLRRRFGNFKDAIPAFGYKAGAHRFCTCLIVFCFSRKKLAASPLPFEKVLHSGRFHDIIEPKHNLLLGGYAEKEKLWENLTEF
jgi:hypothetical protein